jgi:MATE family multidrug resistance protein
MEAGKALDRKIWAIAWPAILSNLSIPILGLVDASILGHLPDARYLAAVALGSAILSFLYWGFGFLRMGTTGHVARATGANDTGAGLRVLARSGALALGIALCVLLLGPFWVQLALALMAPADTLVPIARSYLTIRLLSAPAVLLTYAIVGWFIGRQNTRWPMFILLLTNVLNILLDVVFVVLLGWNSDGAAMATVVAEYCGLALGLVAVRHSAGSALSGPVLMKGLRERGGYAALWRSNRDLFVRTLSLLACLAFFTAMGEKLGEDVVAANALLMQFLLFAAFALDGFAYAAEGLAGSRLGAGDGAGFQRVVARCARWTAFSALAISLFIALGEPLLLPLLSDIEPVQAVLRAAIPWLVLMPLLAAPGYLLDGVFIGAAQTRPLMSTMLVSALCVYLPAWYLTRDWGNHGLWFALALFNLARGLSLGWVYARYTRTQRWITGQSPAGPVQE